MIGGAGFAMMAWRLVLHRAGTSARPKPPRDEYDMCDSPSGDLVLAYYRIIDIAAQRFATLQTIDKCGDAGCFCDTVKL